ncbi:MAG: hypothetical protein M3Y50_02430 [Acidobacteriota bacterium]|nr:hypothetical protein [Acidobacteriota bacterium]
MKKTSKNRHSRAGLMRVLKEKKDTAQGMTSQRPRAAVADPTGSCRYTDVFGQIQCESPVLKAYCEGKGGFFTEDGRC